MANKFVEYVTWGFLIAACLGVLWLLVEPIIWWTEKSEMRLYVRVFLVMFTISTFAILRLYNSIVQNTRFSIKLREVLIKFTNAVPGLERAMKNLNSSLGNVKSSTDTLKKSLDTSSEKTDKLSDRINKIK